MLPAHTLYYFRDYFNELRRGGRLAYFYRRIALRSAGDGRRAVGGRRRVVGSRRRAVGSGRWAAGGAALFGSMHKKTHRDAVSVSILFKFYSWLVGCAPTRRSFPVKSPGITAQGLRPKARAYRSRSETGSPGLPVAADVSHSAYSVLLSSFDTAVYFTPS